MANELKHPCLLDFPFKKKRHRSYVYNDGRQHYCERCGEKIDQTTFSNIPHDYVTTHDAGDYNKPRTATPVDGLERYDISMFGNGAVEMGGGAYVRFDQAEAIIAEGRKRAEVAEYKLDQAINTVQPMIIQRAERAEADNAALTARVKELEAVNHNRECASKYLGEVAEENGNRAQALETQLAAAKKALAKLTLHSNSLALAHVHKTQKNDGIWVALKEARAVLEASHD